MGKRNLRLRIKSRKLRSKSRKLRTRKLRIKSRKLRTKKLRTKKLRTRKLRTKSRKLRTKSRKLRTKYIKNNALNKGGSIHGRAFRGCNAGQLNLLDWFNQEPSTILKLMVINEDNGHGISRQPLIYGYVNTPGFNSVIPCVIVQMWLTNEHGEIPHAQTVVEYITLSEVGTDSSNVVEQLDTLWSLYFKRAREEWVEREKKQSKQYLKGLISINKQQKLADVFVDLVKNGDPSSKIHSGRCNIHDFCVNPRDITYTCSNFVIVFGDFSYHALLYWINQLTSEQLVLECSRSGVEIAGEMDTRANLFLQYHGYETTKDHYFRTGSLATQCERLPYPQELVDAVIQRATDVGIDMNQLRNNLDIGDDEPPVIGVEEYPFGLSRELEDQTDSDSPVIGVDDVGDDYSPVTEVGEGSPVLESPPPITEGPQEFNLPDKLITALKLNRSKSGRINLLNDYNRQDAELSDTDIDQISELYS